jgi:hypothetical protein
MKSQCSDELDKLGYTLHLKGPIEQVPDARALTAVTWCWNQKAAARLLFSDPSASASPAARQCRIDLALRTF